MAQAVSVPATQQHVGERLLAFLRRDRVARWTSRLLLLVLWQLAGELIARFPTPVQTFDILVREFQTPFGSSDWSVVNNELVQNLWISLYRTAAALVVIIAIGVPLGYAMGRWWRVQAYFTDIVTVGIALPAYMWALLARWCRRCRDSSCTCCRGPSRSPAICATCRTPTTCPVRRGRRIWCCPPWRGR